MWQYLLNDPELKKALKIVWLVSGIITLIILILVFFIPDQLVYNTIPTCTSKLQNKQCIMCGSTRAFFEIKNLNFKEAYHLNRFSIFLFFILLINLFLLTINLKKL